MNSDYDDTQSFISYETPEDSKGERLDSFIAALGDKRILSRSYAQKLIDAGMVLVNNTVQKSSYKVNSGDLIDILLPDKTVECDMQPENIPLDIVYEDSDIIVINKARGMVVHPAAGNTSGTLVNALLFHCHDLSDIGGVIRPGIVHRIDKDTSGLLVVAKNNAAHIGLSEQIKEHKVSRLYKCISHGIIEENRGVINAPITRSSTNRKKMCVTYEGNPNSRSAITHFEVIARFDKTTYLKCKLETGRTHQIRVHMEYIGHPICGDPVYGYKDTQGLPGQMLHAYSLSFDHPLTKETLTFSAPLPKDFVDFVALLSGGSFVPD